MIPRKSHNIRPVQMPREFEQVVDRLAQEFSDQTGMPKNKCGAMRRLAKLGPRIKTNGVNFEII